jgi:hypothetical protein
MKDIWKRKERIERERGGDMLSSINYKGKKSCTFEWPHVPFKKCKETDSPYDKIKHIVNEM